MARKKPTTTNTAIEPVKSTPDQNGRFPSSWFFLISILSLLFIGATGAFLLNQPSSLSSSPTRPKGSLRSANSPTESPVGSAKLELPTQPETFEVDLLRDEMIAQARRLEKAHSKSPEALDLAASVFFDLNQPEEADRLWKRCFALIPAEPELYTNYARFLNQLDRSEESIELLNKAHSRSIESAVSYFQLAKSYDLLGEAEKALAVSEEIIRRFPDYGECYLLIGKLKNELGQFEDARRSLQKAIELQQPEMDVWPMLVPVLVRLGDRQKAKELQQKLKSELNSNSTNEGDPQPFHVKSSTSLRNRAVRLFRLASLIEKKANNYDLGKELLARSLKLDPNNPSSLLKLAEHFVQEKDVDRAIAVLQRLIELQPENVVNFSNLAVLAFQAGNQQLAVNTLELGLKNHVDATNLQIPLGRIYLSLGKPLQAREVATRVLEKQENLEALKILAASYQSTGDHHSAARIMERAQLIPVAENRK